MIWLAIIDSWLKWSDLIGLCFKFELTGGLQSVASGIKLMNGLQAGIYKLENTIF